LEGLTLPLPFKRLRLEHITIHFSIKRIKDVETPLQHPSPPWSSNINRIGGVFLLIGCFVCHNIDLLINNISKICLNQ
jgi:hypothetical protein